MKKQMQSLADENHTLKSKNHVLETTEQERTDVKTQEAIRALATANERVLARVFCWRCNII